MECALFKKMSENIFEVENHNNNLASAQTSLTEITVENLIFTNSQQQCDGHW